MRNFSNSVRSNSWWLPVVSAWLFLAADGALLSSRKNARRVRYAYCLSDYGHSQTSRVGRTDKGVQKLWKMESNTASAVTPVKKKCS